MTAAALTPWAICKISPNQSDARASFYSGHVRRRQAIGGRNGYDAVGSGFRLSERDVTLDANAVQGSSVEKIQRPTTGKILYTEILGNKKAASSMQYIDCERANHCEVGAWQYSAVWP